MVKLIRKRDVVRGRYSEKGVIIDKENVNVKILKWISNEEEDLLIPPLPTLYLVRKGDLEVFRGRKKIGFEELLMEYSKRDKHILAKLIVFEDLVKRGYHLVEKGDNFLEVYTHVTGKKAFNLFVIDEGYSLDVEEILDAVSRGETVVAIVERRGGITYYSASKFRGGKQVE